MEHLLEWPDKPEFVQTRSDVIKWWEARRLHFNAYVGVVGIATWLSVLIFGSMAVAPGVDFEEPLAMIFGPPVYAILANCCYTLGWIFDTLFYCGEPRVRLYKAGVVFSVVLTASPGVWAIVAWIMTLITGHKIAD